MFISVAVLNSISKEHSYITEMHCLEDCISILCFRRRTFMYDSEIQNRNAVLPTCVWGNIILFRNRN